jgi:hypothetical protein
MAIFGSRRFQPITIEGKKVAESLQLRIEGVLEETGISAVI